MIVTWEQPWYQRTGHLTKKLPPLENKENFRTGKFSKEECDTVEQNWNKFIELFEIPNTPICLARWRNRKKRSNVPEEYVRRYVMEFLAQGLERNIYQVYHYFVSNYGNLHKNSYYSKLEEKVIETCLYHDPPNAVLYSSMVLSREKRGIQKKISKNGAYQEKQKATKWTLSLASKVLRSLMKHSGYSIEHLKDKTFPIEVWKKVSDDTDLKVPSLQSFWYYKLHVQLFLKQDIKIKKLRRKVLKLLNAYPYKVWPDIRWKELLHHFPDGMTSHFLYKISAGVCSKIKNYLKMPLCDVIQCGLRYLKQNRRLSDKRLKTLIMNDEGMLEVKRYNDEY
ncbi:uncharacterized protein LOC126977161 isoform X2 [Leptidea sinapis]|nr:uncharacterized protein LOC126977161 isoform X2 [Leptidea sinapis]